MCMIWLLTVARSDGAEGRRLEALEASQASALRSRAVSISFYTAKGKLNITDLSEPLTMFLEGCWMNFPQNAEWWKLGVRTLSLLWPRLLEVADENATCAFWDEDAAKWSDKGLVTLGFSNGLLTCRTSHLSIFGGVIDAVLTLDITWPWSWTLCEVLWSFVFVS